MQFRSVLDGTTTMPKQSRREPTRLSRFQVIISPALQLYFRSKRDGTTIMPEENRVAAAILDQRASHQPSTYLPAPYLMARQCPRLGSSSSSFPLDGSDEVLAPGRSSLSAVLAVVLLLRWSRVGKCASEVGRKRLFGWLLFGCSNPTQPHSNQYQSCRETIQCGLGPLISNVLSVIPDTYSTQNNDYY
jgi:hypothetical protein